jgi:hypothetical protein
MDNQHNSGSQTTYNNMIYNESLATSYGKFSEISETSSPMTYKPMPSKDDYVKGYISRFFSKKINENLITEIQTDNANKLNSQLYKVVNLSWKISGPKNSIYKNGILDKYGVTDSNRFEIDRIHKEEGVDLSSALPNLLEYWKGS